MQIYTWLGSPLEVHSSYQRAPLKRRNLFIFMQNVSTAYVDPPANIIPAIGAGARPANSTTFKPRSAIVC